MFAILFSKFILAHAHIQKEALEIQTRFFAIFSLARRGVSEGRKGTEKRKKSENEICLYILCDNLTLYVVFLIK